MIAIGALISKERPCGWELLGGSTVTVEPPLFRTSLFTTEGSGVSSNGVIDRIGIPSALLVPSVPSGSILVVGLFSFEFVLLHTYGWHQIMRPCSCSN